MIFSVVRLDPQRSFKMLLCLIESPVRRQERAEVNMSLCRIGTPTYRLGEFFRCFIGSPGVLQLGGVVNMGACASRKIGNDRRQTIELTPGAVHLGKPKHP